MYYVYNVQCAACIECSSYETEAFINFQLCHKHYGTRYRNKNSSHCLCNHLKCGKLYTILFRSTEKKRKRDWIVNNVIISRKLGASTVVHQNNNIIFREIMVSFCCHLPSLLQTERNTNDFHILGWISPIRHTCSVYIARFICTLHYISLCPLRSLTVRVCVNWQENWVSIMQTESSKFETGVCIIFLLGASDLQVVYSLQPALCSQKTKNCSHTIPNNKLIISWYS